jgi:hypothetical protein
MQVFKVFPSDPHILLVFVMICYFSSINLGLLSRSADYFGYGFVSLYLFREPTFCFIDSFISLIFALKFFFFFNTRASTQGLHLEPLHQPYFCEGCFEIRSCKLFAQGWLQTVILLISAPWVARITGMSHWCLGALNLLLLSVYWF